MGCKHAELLKRTAFWLVNTAVSDADDPVMASFRQVQSAAACRTTSGVCSQTRSGYNEGFIQAEEPAVAAY